MMLVNRAESALFVESVGYSVILLDGGFLQKRQPILGYGLKPIESHIENSNTYIRLGNHYRDIAVSFQSVTGLDIVLETWIIGSPSVCVCNEDEITLSKIKPRSTYAMSVCVSET